MFEENLNIYLILIYKRDVNIYILMFFLVVYVVWVGYIWYFDIKFFFVM